MPDDVSLDRPGGPLIETHFWRRFASGWHLLFVAALVLVGVLIVVDDGVSPGGRWLGGALIVILALWYARFGVRAFRYDDHRAGRWYLIGAALCFAALLAVSPGSAFLLFAFNPQVFLLGRGWRVRLTLLATFAVEDTASLLYHLGSTWNTFEKVAVLVAFPSLFAIVLGTFITGIIGQSGRRADLIDQLTLAQAELARERHDAGVYAERERLAADIHDTLAQGLASLVLLAQAARAGRSRDPVALDQRLELIERTARDNLDEARALVAALTPPDLAGRGLPDALARLADRYTRDTGAAIRVTTTGSGAGTAEADVVLLRTAQEALANIHKYAAATTVHIELSRVDGSRVLTVTDDGCGFDPTTRPAGYGLPAMRSRAAASGGTCEIRSAPGAGTSVRVELPT